MKSCTAQALILIGASAGGVQAALELAPALPANFPVPILFVQHIGAHPSRLWELVQARGPNAAVAASDGAVPRPGTIYFAPPDHHMLLQGGLIRLSRGPKEHHARPAIDPLFRSAALDCGPQAIGVVLTGRLDDGSAGLRAIKQCGGTAVVQDPLDAYAPDMPQNALSHVAADHVVPLAALGPLLHELALARRPVPSARREPPAFLRQEQQVISGERAMENLQAIARPSALTCPDCGGVLFELKDKHPVRYRCHTGHGFSLLSLAAAQEEVSDAALWSSLRTLQEKEFILRRLAQAQGPGASAAAEQALREADELAQACTVLRRLSENAPSPRSFAAAPGSGA
jgi:two-component system chemotaxis response regulator CheB